MALLPVYRWLGLDDDLTRRQQWGVNVIGLLAVVFGAHALGVIDLDGISASALEGLPGGSRTIVAVLALAAGLAIVHTAANRTLMDTAWVTAAAVGGFFLIDLFYIHPHVFDNLPALFYWAAKPVWVGIPMFAVAWWLIDNTDLSRRLAYTLAAVAGVIVLQLYYTVVPIPIVGGESVQVGLIGNLTTGVQVHGLALLGALAAVVVLIQGRRYVGGWS